MPCAASSHGRFSECCFDLSLLVHKMNLFDLHHKYADVMHLDEVVAPSRRNGQRTVS
jgi:hypothetical protein